MNLKDLPFPVYGDAKFRGKCPPEAVEMASFFSRLRREYPNTLGVIALHPRNEQLLLGGQFKAIVKHKAEGMTKGASDIVIPAARPFICELKRRDHTLSAWQEGQIAYLETAKKLDAFACVALGAEAAWEALMDWMKENEA
jgi:hypothetical protein